MFDYEYWGNEVFPANTNMILEEFFLRRAAQYPVACMRFFSVPKDAVVLGYAQATDALKKKDASFDVVRRPTGGSHVQIGKNILAYSFAVPRDGSFRNYEDMRAYYAQHVADALEGLGIENIAVDNRASTINVDGKVVASHAIIWGVESALLHGLIVLDPYDVGRIMKRVFLAKRKIGGRLYTEQAALENIPAVSTLLEGRKMALKDLIGEAVLSRVTEGKYRRIRIDGKILGRCSELETKYCADEWIEGRKPPFAAEEIEEIPGEELDGKLRKNLGYCLYSQVKNKDFRKMAGP